MGERGKAEIEMDLRNIVNIYIYIRRKLKISKNRELGS
jgi:hypothetical protein